MTLTGLPAAASEAAFSRMPERMSPLPSFAHGFDSHLKRQTSGKCSRMVFDGWINRLSANEEYHRRM